ncbi:MAG TPA: glutamate 5-kinase [Verrucomicrobiae bacterium]|nr:glutamate 5-kinase [Verrucomicrobiae bacterium]
MNYRQEILGRSQRMVVKLGTGLLTNSAGALDKAKISRICGQLADLSRKKTQVVLVSSGAIAAGMGHLGMVRRPKNLPELQAAAAIGQGKLMSIYDAIFGTFGVPVAQLLLTHDDLKNRDRHLNARNTLRVLLARGVMPIINENDTVAVDEIKFGDNDRLAALAATLIDADLLVILSHVEGLLDAESRVISVVPEITREIEQLAGDTDRATSVGGMASKVEAARIVTRAGIPMVIANGERAGALVDLLSGQDIGTVFLPKEVKLASRKRWIAFFQHPAGTVVVDDGAVQALRQNGKSLLAKGIVSTDGKFGKGDLVSIRDKDRVEFARGLAKVGSAELGAGSGVVVHRDDLVIL